MDEGKCPHCGSDHIVEGRFEGGNFFPAERRSIATAFLPMWVRARARLCVECGLIWMHADVNAALRLLEQLGDNKLQARMRSWHKQSGQNLLRASTAPQEASEVLLRPASSHPETTPGEMLRAADEREDETILSVKSNTDPTSS